MGIFKFGNINSNVYKFRAYTRIGWTKFIGWNSYLIRNTFPRKWIWNNFLNNVLTNREFFEPKGLNSEENLCDLYLTVKFRPQNLFPYWGEWMLYGIYGCEQEWVIVNVSRSQSASSSRRLDEFSTNTIHKS